MVGMGGSGYRRDLTDHDDNQGHEANQLNGEECEAYGDEGVRLHVTDVNQRLHDARH